jgi:hypothetical protein
VWDAFSSGAIPVYGGAPNIGEYVPPSGVINMDEFATPEELAAHLVRVADDQALFDAYHTWRTDPDVMIQMEYIDHNVRGRWRCVFTCKEILLRRLLRMYGVCVFKETTVGSS